MQYEELQVRFPAGVLRSELRLRTAHIAPSDLVRLMGYANARKATLDRIARVLDDPWLAWRTAASISATAAVNSSRSSAARSASRTACASAG